MILELPIIVRPLNGSSVYCTLCGKVIDPFAGITTLSGGTEAWGKEAFLMLENHVTLSPLPTPDSDRYRRVELALGGDDGQIELHFCSTICLRAFLNEAVNRLEDAIANDAAN